VCANGVDLVSFLELFDDLHAEAKKKLEAPEGEHGKD
jgi:hypothetical protein